MKLKTLKDLTYIDIIDKGPVSVLVINVDRVKQEAIKWANKINLETLNQEVAYRNGKRVQWIKDFFNLTEDDLK
jgi:hypothetical protein